MRNFENKENASAAGKRSKRGASVEVKNIRETIYFLVQKKQVQIEKWLDEVAKESPEKGTQAVYITLRLRFTPFTTY